MLWIWIVKFVKYLVDYIVRQDESEGADAAPKQEQLFDLEQQQLRFRQGKSRGSNLREIEEGVRGGTL